MHLTTVILCYLCDVIITSDVIIDNRLHCDVIMPFHCSVMIFHCSVMLFVQYQCLERSVAREF